ncbi:glycosyltransferase family 4 protein [Jatrophihabitans endophyticus]|uniref:glycosyltransferase family 4 protein n=1 Tax=Jatrophihabitans endophyticus TaxID=1206085 RepID=UPI001A05C268|nr:glycosyltransferase family 4 protein [Jatrophihabitans endophyticus]MBE7187699.1 glycosyltransferase family 4 protein [Jatrophihabitans endophyticus]
MSGISTHTCMLTNAFADTYRTSAVLMRRLIPRRLYPGRARVGADLTTMRYRDDVRVFDGVDYFWFPSLVGALWLLWRERPAVVLFQWWSGTVVHTFVALAAAARLLGARVVIEFHETLDTAESAMPGIDAYVRVASRPLMAMTSGAFVHSTSDVDPVLARFPGLRGKPVRVVPMGSHDTTADPERWTQAHPGAEVFELLYFGTIRPYKGLENLIRAFDALTPEQVAKFHLTVVGETWQDWTLPADLIEKSHHRDRITFVNTYVTDEQAARYFRSADAVVLPYLRSSGSGPLHMAMSHGVPVAVTAVGGLVEHAAAYTGARLVAPDDVEDLTRALLELPGMPGPHDDPHSWAATTSAMSELFE